ncbi:zf-HC2 domain-containing protein [Arthrobacter sp. TMN-49]
MRVASPTPHSHGDFLQLSDLQLLELTREGDETAYVALWHRHRSAGLRAARSITGKFDPEDMLQEAFTRILVAIRGHAGPREVFRPYLYSVLRSVSMSWDPQGEATTPLDEVYQQNEPSYSFEGVTLDKTITSRAFANLKPEWRRVLWYVEVEGMQPREVAPLLGLKPNAVSALALRAKEGLRISWLQAHLNPDAADPDCKWCVERLGAYNRDTLSDRLQDRVQDHLRGCLKCSILVEEVDQVGRNLGLVLLPLLLGPTALAGMGAPVASVTTSSASTTTPPAQTSAQVAGTSSGRFLLIAAATAVVVVVGSIAAAAVSLSLNAQELPATIAVGTPTASADAATPAYPEPTVGTAPAAPATPAAIPPVVESVSSPLQSVDLPRIIPLPAPTSETTQEPTQSSAPEPRPTTSPTPTPSPTPSPAPTPAPSPTPSPATVVPMPPAFTTILERGLFLPLLNGTGSPGAQVVVLSGSEQVAVTTVDESGFWSVVPEATPGPDGTVRFSAFQLLGGLRSQDSALSVPVELKMPEIVSLTKDDHSTTVTFNGPAGATVQAILDGVPTGTYHQLTGESITRTLPDLPPGEHALALRFVDPDGGLHGASVTVTLP